MDIEVVRPGVVLTLAGRLGAATVADVRDALTSAVEAGEGDLVVDLHDVELADATGLGVLVGAHRRADRAGRRLVLRRVPQRIERLLVATRLHHVLCVEPPSISVIRSRRSPARKGHRGGIGRTRAGSTG